METNAFGYCFRTKDGVVSKLLEDNVYHLRHVIAHDGDLFTANFSFQSLENSIGDESWGLDNVVVTVYPTLSIEPPTILRSPLSSTTTFGDPELKLFVIADGFGPFTYQWLHEETNIANATNATLTLRQLDWSHGGTYQVVVANAGGSTTSQLAHITILPPDQGFLTNGVVAYYPFNGSADDESGNADNGVVIHANLVQDRFGQNERAYSFDGSQEIGIRTAGSFLPTGSHPRTISVWLKPDNLITDVGQTWISGGLIQYGKDNGGAGLLYAQFVWQATPGLVSFYLGTENGWGWDSWRPDWDFSRWHQAVWTFEGNTNASLYVDGQKAAFESSSGGVVFSTQTGPMFIGAAGGRYFSGALDDIRMYDRALSAQEVAKLYAYEKVGGTDSDGDGLSDYEESRVFHTYPLNLDTDVDGVSDGDEVAEGTNPLDSASGPPPRLVGPIQIAGKVGLALAQDLTTEYPLSSFTFVNLPPGFNGDTKTGRITGLPVAVGTNQTSVLLANKWGTRTNVLTFIVAKGTPTITWAPPASLTYGTILDTNFYNAVASVPGTFSYAPAVGTKPDIGSPIPASVTFTPDDTFNYDNVTVTTFVTVTKADQSISFEVPASVVLGDTPTVLNASASSDLPVQYEVVSGPGVVTGSTLSALRGGTITVRASQPGDEHYNAALPVIRAVDVKLRLDVPVVPGGIVLREPDSGILNYQQTAVLTAIPEDGYLFTGWGGDVVSRENPLIVVVTNNTWITPLFTPIWKLAVTSTTGGHVLTEPSLATVTNGCTVVATAIPDDGYGFRGWKGTITSTSNPLEVVLSTNISLTAEFARTVKVSIVQTEGGTISAMPVQSQYFAGDTLTLVAAANEGFRFQDWKAPLQGLTNGTAFILANDLAVEAEFKKLQQVIVSRIGDGTVTIQGGIYHDVGETVSVAAEPKAGWAFVGWSGSVTNNTNPLTVTVSSNTVLNATFKRLFTLSVSATGGGSVDVSPAGGSYLDETVVSLLAKPEHYWRLESWAGGISSTNNPLRIVMTNDLSVVAVFEPSHRLLVFEKQDMSEGFQLLVEGELGVSYVIETSSGLISWSLLTTITNLANPTEYLDKQARAINRRFYRIRPEVP